MLLFLKSLLQFRKFRENGFFKSLFLELEIDVTESQKSRIVKIVSWWIGFTQIVTVFDRWARAEGEFKRQKNILKSEKKHKEASKFQVNSEGDWTKWTRKN